MRAVPADDLLTEAELAEYCRVSLRTVAGGRRDRAAGAVGWGPPALQA